ncbi:hypothetical protein [Cellvibrio sp.]
MIDLIVFFEGLFGELYGQKGNRRFEKIAFISLFFYTIFLGVLIYFSIAKFALVLFELEEKNAFKLVSDIVEPLAHIATVGVFAWAIWTFREQQSEKQKDDAVKRASSYSIRLINYVSDRVFTLTPNTVNVLNSYLSVLCSDFKDDNVQDDVKKETFLALMVVKEFFKDVSLKDITGFEFNGSYSKMIDSLKQAYKNPEILCKLDSRLYRRVFVEKIQPGVSLRLSPPDGAIRLHQIETLISLLFFLSEDESRNDLSKFQEFTSSNVDRGIFYPALYASYYFYANGYFAIDGNGEVDLLFDED